MTTVQTPPEVAPGPAAPTRRIAPRRSLPSGRAVVGALLVTLAVIGVFVATGQGRDAPSTRFAVAAAPIDQGEVIGASDFELRPIDLPDGVAANGFDTADELIGATAISPVEAGELLQRGHVARALEGAAVGPTLEFSFPIGRSRAPRTLRRGDTVAVLATHDSAGEPVTGVVVESATVIAFEADDSGALTRTAAVLTLALTDPLEQMAAAHAAQTAELTVIRTTKSGGALLPSRYPAGGDDVR